MLVDWVLEAGDRPTYDPARRTTAERVSGGAIRPLEWKSSADLVTPPLADVRACHPTGTRTHAAGESIRTSFFD